MSEIYYNPSECIKKNKLFNFIIGERGAGKTYAYKKLCYEKWLNNREQFILIRRTKDELKEAKDKFTADITHEFPSNELSVKGNVFYCDGVECGYAVALSTSLKKKSVPYPNVTTILYDEFIIPKSALRYLTNEVFTFLEFMSSVMRIRNNCNVYLLANTITVANPYFLYFNIEPSHNQRFTIKGDMLIENVDTPVYKEQAKQSRLGRVIRNLDYSKYNHGEEFMEDIKTFIERKHRHSVYKFKILGNNMVYGFWSWGSKMWISDKFDPCGMFSFTLDTNCHEHGVTYCNSFRENYYLEKVISAYKSGNLYFENIKLKNTFMNIMKKGGIY